MASFFGQLPPDPFAVGIQQAGQSLGQGVAQGIQNRAGSQDVQLIAKFLSDPQQDISQIASQIRTPGGRNAFLQLLQGQQETPLQTAQRGLIERQTQSFGQPTPAQRFAQTKEDTRIAERGEDLEIASRDRLQTRRDATAKLLRENQERIRQQEREFKEDDRKAAVERRAEAAEGRAVASSRDRTLAQMEAKLVKDGKPIFKDETDPKTGVTMQRHVLTKELKRSPATNITTNVNTKQLTEGQIQRFAAKKGLIQAANNTYDLWLEGYTGPIQGRITWIKNRIGGGTKDSAKFESGVASLLETMYNKAGKQLSDKELAKWKPTLPSLFDPDKTFDGKMESIIENVSTYLSIEENLAQIPNTDGSATSSGGLTREQFLALPENQQNQYLLEREGR